MDTIHNAIFFIDTSTMLDTSKPNYLIGMLNFGIIASYGPIIYMDSIHNALLFIDTSSMLDTTKVIWEAIFGNNCW